MHVDKQPKTASLLDARTEAREIAQLAAAIRAQEIHLLIRRLLRGALALALPLVLLAACYAFENWRGKRLWNQYREAAEARGQSFKLPSRTPEMEARVQASITSAKELEELSRSFRAMWSQHINPLPSAPYWEFEDIVGLSRHILSMKSGQTNKESIGAESNANAAARAAAAAVVLESFQEQDAFIEKLRAACRRPNFPYPFGYAGRLTAWDFPPTPNILGALEVCRYLKVRMTAELAVGRTAGALRDLQLMLDLSDTLRPDDFLIAWIGRIGCRTYALTAIWAGLADRRFTDAELQDLQQQLISVDLFAELSRAFLTERNHIVSLYEWVQRTGDYNEFGGLPAVSALSWLPDGWIQLEKLNYVRRFDVFLAAAFPNGRKGLQLGAVQDYDQALRELQSESVFRAVLNHDVLASVLMPKISDLCANCVSAQVITDQIRLACGLERFYLQQARYPENLGQLAPEFLPKLPLDPLSGEGYRYAPDQNGRYKLWSVGPDEKDNGGVQGEGPQYHSRGSGDWVWRYPEL